MFAWGLGERSGPGIFAGMGRRKSISDEDVLLIARRVFIERGVSASTREIAREAGISEAVLYQRFGSKDGLFFACMRPQGPDIERLFGPSEPDEDALSFLKSSIVRLGEHFAEHIPRALQVMTHPTFDRASLAQLRPGGPEILHEALAERIRSLEKRGEIDARDPSLVARTLISLAHDWALRRAQSSSAKGPGELVAMVELVWRGIRAETRKP